MGGRLFEDSCRPVRALWRIRGAAFGALAIALVAAGPARAQTTPPPTPPPAQTPPAQAQTQPENGRIVATITTLEGSVHMPGMQVELRTPEQDLVIARTTTDGVGQVTFPDVPPGQYVIFASREGFTGRNSPVFIVRAGQTTNVNLDVPLSFAPPEIEVRPTARVATTPRTVTDSIRAVSTSDMLSGNLFETAPLQGDDFQSLLPLLPGVVRDGDGRLRIKGGLPTQAGLQISSSSLNDPSTGDFDLDLPSRSVQSVEVLANPFAAEFGRFSTSVTQIRTRRGTNEWEFAPGGLVPRFRKLFAGIRGFEPRFSARGPIIKDRLFMAEDVQYRYVATPVKSLPDEPEVKLNSFDSFTRIDGVVSPRHFLGGTLITFPREIENVTMNTFRAEPTSPEFIQAGWSVGVVDRFSIRPNLAIESTLSFRKFEIEVEAENPDAMVYAPETQSGGFFNDQERDVTSYQWVEALSLSRPLWHGQHVFKFGFDLQHSRFQGSSSSHPVEVRRDDGSLAELTVFSGSSSQLVTGNEFAVFAQDRWRIGGRITLELGLRLDRDAVVERVNWSPRAGIAIGVLPEGRGILRGGFGKFVQRTPFNVGAFESFEPRTVTRFAADGTPLGPSVLFTNVTGEIHTPEAYVGNIEWDQRFSRKVLLKLSYLGRHGNHEYIVVPDAAARELRLTSDGKSNYREFEATARWVANVRRDLTLSYVWSRGVGDLNSYDLFYGNLRTPLIRENQYNLSPTDVRHRILLRGTIGLPGQWDLAPVLELRSGFPYSAVDEFQDFVGDRNRAGRLPSVETLDFSISRPWEIKGRRFRAGLRIYNVFGSTAYRDIQNNITSPNYGTAYNPIERSIGFVFGSAK
ncbi:MAG TPA: TonB-dependent receptor [Vicinamibacterales bacterium]|nr:TonB-dependent receptor [Vicinamibacterales bacterium]